MLLLPSAGLSFCRAKPGPVQVVVSLVFFTSAAATLVGMWLLNVLDGHASSHQFGHGEKCRESLH